MCSGNGLSRSIVWPSIKLIIQNARTTGTNVQIAVLPINRKSGPAKYAQEPSAAAINTPASRLAKFQDDESEAKRAASSQYTNNGPSMITLIVATGHHHDCCASISGLGLIAPINCMSSHAKNLAKRNPQTG